MKKHFLILLCFLLPALVAGQIRHKQTINENWKFQKGNPENAASGSFNDADWETITLPHTWNIEDIQDEPYGWYRGVGWYRKSISIGNIADNKRLFLSFEGANQVCEVFVNGKSAGEKHVGGYTPFAYDITDLVIPNNKNTIAIKLDNAHNKNIAPLSADFVFYGGVYRDVYLIEVDATHFDLLHQGNGVYITTPNVSESKAEISIRADILNNANKGAFEIIHTVLDVDRNKIATQSQKINAAKNSAQTFQSKNIILQNPNLWSPDSPYLYTVVSELKDKSGKVLDKIENPLGLRWFSFDPQNGFFINGKHLKLMGTNRHQDYINFGNALTDDMHRYDLKMMKDLGINCFRISHYPHDPSVLEMADRYGFICFEEIPIINYITRTPEYLESCKKQISEMIRRDYNHPCIVTWNQSNETALSRPPDLKDEDYEEYSVALADFYKQLNEHILSEDPTRFSMIVHNSGVEDHFKRGYHQAQVVGYNLYMGWYEQKINDIYANLELLPKTNPNVAWFITEFGAGSDPRIHSFEPIPWDHSIEFQLEFNKVYQKAITKYPFIAGGTVWNFNDFFSEGRREVQPHLNNKGLVTSDRRKKDSYYFFQAAWSKEVVANIGPKLWTERGGVESVNNSGYCSQSVEIYANTQDAELFLNNVSLGKKSITDYVAKWDVPFVNGKNTLLLRAWQDGKEIIDYMTVNFNLIPHELKNNKQDFEEIAVNVGSNCFFNDENKNNYLWMPDQPYQKGNFGYTAGKPYVRDEKRGILGVVENIAGTVNEPIFQTQLIDPEYRFDVPDGNYEVSLLFADLNAVPSYSVFDILINDIPQITDLNLTDEYGKYNAITKRFEINVENDNGIRIALPSKKGNSVLNGIVVRKIY